MELIKVKGQKYLQSKSLLRHGFHHAFYTKTSHEEEPRTLIKEHKKQSIVHQLEQIHSKKVIFASQESSPPWPKGDGIISTRENQGLFIYSADCIPILFGDKQKRKVAACHVGLKGLKSLILKEIIEKLSSSGTRTKDLIIAIGPAISGPKYQVTKGDIRYLLKTDYHKGITIPKEERNNLAEKPSELPLLIEDIDPQKVFFDIRISAKRQLIRLGIRSKQIEISSLCTYSNPDLFYSWRRDRKRSFQWSFISS